MRCSRVGLYCCSAVKTLWPDAFSYQSRILRNSKNLKDLLKSIFHERTSEKGPSKNTQKLSVEINGAVFVNFWLNPFSKYVLK